jgi:NitT/TauT family transport system ATP-binding protein
VEPEVLFMDEPFSALDVLTAENLRSELLDLWSDRKLPTRAVFIVTHNIEEAVLLADRIIVLGKNPGVIRTDFRVELPRPRDRKNPVFEQIVDHVYKVLTRPDAVPVLETVAPNGTAGAPAATPKYQMLPHARPGGVTGLVEILYDGIQAGNKGREDIYRLADELAFEIDEILPTVEAAALLGFLKVSEGDVEITPLGITFIDSDIVGRKELFRRAALENATLIRQITRSLEKKANHKLSDEFFHDILDEHFTEDETLLQLQTAIVWGRYAELFDHDSNGKFFFIPEEEEEADEDEHDAAVDSGVKTGPHS